MEQKGSRLRKFWFEWLKPLMVVLIVTGAFRSAIADWNDVPSGSMKPTIMEGDRIFVNKLAYDLKIPFTTVEISKWDDPHRGDIIVLYSPADGKRLVKRAVAVPGDTIEMRNSALLVNGKPAQYDPLPGPSVTDIPEKERPRYLFFSERVGDRKHAIMLTPLKSALRDFGPAVLPAGKYFVMGDNRDDSFDSRFFGYVDRSQIVGRATTVVASVNPDDYYLPRWHRWFSKLR